MRATRNRVYGNPVTGVQIPPHPPIKNPPYKRRVFAYEPFQTVKTTKKGGIIIPLSIHYGAVYEMVSALVCVCVPFVTLETSCITHQSGQTKNRLPSSCAIIKIQ